MPQEIERKFLVKGKPWEQQSNVNSRQIQQGYISKSKKHTVRIRIVSSKTSPAEKTSTVNTLAFITIKGPKCGFTCDEFEYRIPIEEAFQLINLCDGDLIEKTRHTFRDENDQRWEVDVFKGINDGLVVAEIELVSEATPVVLPSWISMEVTFDKRYSNSYLSAHKI
jgi:CYTH domain-containing protein